MEAKASDERKRRKVTVIIDFTGQYVPRCMGAGMLVACQPAGDGKEVRL